MKYIYLFLSISLLLSSCSMLPDQWVPGSDGDDEEEERPLTILVINNFCPLDAQLFMQVFNLKSEQEQCIV